MSGAWKAAGSGQGAARASAIAVLLVLLCSCTSIGLHRPQVRRQLDFGSPDAVRLCLYLDAGISARSARLLIDEAWRDEAPLYGLQITVAETTRWLRPGFTMDGIMEALTREPLRPGCDRIFALVGRHLGDVVWGMFFLPEVLGAVNDETLTHGYAIVRRASLNQIISSPRQVVRHEIYHLLGCDQHFQMGRCYQQIARLKAVKRASESEFFPAWDLVNRRVLASRDAVNEALTVSRTKTAATSR